MRGPISPKEAFSLERLRWTLDRVDTVDGKRLVDSMFLYDTGMVGSHGGPTSASGDLIDALRCLFAGYKIDAPFRLKRARDRAITLVQNGLKKSAFGARQEYIFLSLCNWLLDGIHDQRNLDLAVDHAEQHLQTEGQGGRVSVALSMPCYVDAGAWEICDRRLSLTGIESPAKLSAIRSEGTLAKAHCDHFLRGLHSGEELQAARERSLKMWIPYWLGPGGNYDRAAIWLKISHWTAAGALSPEETLLKAYDYLPDAERPVWTDPPRGALVYDRQPKSWYSRVLRAVIN